MSSLGDPRIVLQLRDLIEKISLGVVNRERPKSFIAEVVSIDTTRRKALVRTAGYKDSGDYLEVSFTRALEPIDAAEESSSGSGNIVGIDGSPGNYFIDRVLSGDFKTGGTSTADTGWLPFPLSAEYTSYNEDTECQIRRIGRTVFTRGLVKPVSGDFIIAETTIGVLDEGWIPAQNVYLSAVTSDATTAARVIFKHYNSPGDVTVSRTKAFSYVSINTSWLVD